MAFYNIKMIGKVVTVIFISLIFGINNVAAVNKTKISNTEKILWQIGKFNNSSDEFVYRDSKRTDNQNLNSKYEVNYIVI